MASSASVGSNFLSSIILAPILLIFSAISLSTLQKLLDWVTRIATTPQSGTLRKIKPYVKQLNASFERILEVAILLLCLVLESASNRALAQKAEERAANTAKKLLSKPKPSEKNE